MLVVNVMQRRPLVVDCNDIEFLNTHKRFNVFTSKFVESVSPCLLFLTDQPLFCLRTTLTDMSKGREAQKEQFTNGILLIPTNPPSVACF